MVAQILLTIFQVSSGKPIFLQLFHNDCAVLLWQLIHVSSGFMRSLKVRRNIFASHERTFLIIAPLHGKLVLPLRAVQHTWLWREPITVSEQCWPALRATLLKSDPPTTNAFGCSTCIQPKHYFIDSGLSCDGDPRTESPLWQSAHLRFHKRVLVEQTSSAARPRRTRARCAETLAQCRSEGGLLFEQNS